MKKEKKKEILNLFGKDLMMSFENIMGGWVSYKSVKRISEDNSILEVIFWHDNLINMDSHETLDYLLNYFDVSLVKTFKPNEDEKTFIHS